MQRKPETGERAETAVGLIALSLAVGCARAALRWRRSWAALPFLSLQGRWWPRHVIIEGQGKAIAMPWPMPPWFAWSFREESSRSASAYAGADSAPPDRASPLLVAEPVRQPSFPTPPMPAVVDVEKSVWNRPDANRHAGNGGPASAARSGSLPTAGPVSGPIQAVEANWSASDIPMPLPVARLSAATPAGGLLNLIPILALHYSGRSTVLGTIAPGALQPSASLAARAPLPPSSQALLPGASLAAGAPLPPSSNRDRLPTGQMFPPTAGDIPMPLPVARLSAATPAGGLLSLIPTLALHHSGRSATLGAITPGGPLPRRVQALNKPAFPPSLTLSRQEEGNMQLVDSSGERNLGGVDNPPGRIKNPLPLKTAELQLTARLAGQPLSILLQLAPGSPSTVSSSDSLPTRLESVNFSALTWPAVHPGSALGSRNLTASAGPPTPTAALPLPWPKPRSAPEPGPYAVNPWQGMTAVTGAIETLVARQVKTAVKQQRDELQAQVPSRPVVVDPNTIAATVVSDDVVRRLVQKIHTLAQEERFRSGLLR